MQFIRVSIEKANCDIKHLCAGRGLKERKNRLLDDALRTFAIYRRTPKDCTIADLLVVHIFGQTIGSIHEM